ncbi:hypothetical protein ISP15_14565 [Dyella jejuensis]|uniref:Ankyrin repeat domain-containing protein n=1 Tax=Dyella jejuensis TaxID=1432009 RepID=A0ABW8JKA9_9GAMM
MGSNQPHRGKSLALGLACAIAASGMHAQQSTVQHALTPADRAAVHDYTLTDAAYRKLLDTARDAKANKVKIDILDPGAHSLDETAAHLNADPGVHALLDRHGLTARDFLLGEYALLGAEFAVKYAGQPGFDASMANPANIALYRRHEAEIDALSGDDSNN